MIFCSVNDLVDIVGCEKIDFEFDQKNVSFETHAPSDLCTCACVARGNVTRIRACVCMDVRAVAFTPLLYGMYRDR